MCVNLLSVGHTIVTFVVAQTVCLWRDLGCTSNHHCCIVWLPEIVSPSRLGGFAVLSGSDVLLCFLHCSTLADSASRYIGNTYLYFWAGWVGGGSKSKHWNEYHWRHRQHLALLWVVSYSDPPHMWRESGHTSPNPGARFRISKAPSEITKWHFFFLGGGNVIEKEFT